MCLYALRSCGWPHSNLVFQLRVHSLRISGFELDPHYCQLPVAEEVQPDRNSCPVVLTVVWIELDSNCTRQTSDLREFSVKIDFKIGPMLMNFHGPSMSVTANKTCHRIMILYFDLAHVIKKGT